MRVLESTKLNTSLLLSHLLENICISETLVEICAQTGRVVGVRCHGTLCDGSNFETQNLVSEVEDHGSPLGAVGKMAQGDEVPSEEETPHQTRWWTKAVFTDNSVLITTAKGYEVHNFILDTMDE